MRIFNMRLRRHFQRSPLNPLASVMCLAAACALSGCGGGSGGDDAKKTPRVAASGTVEFDGNPVAAGTVTFINQATGNLATCNIANGSYSCSRAEGPNPGDNAVTIVGKETADGDPMWARAWSTKVKVEEDDFSEDFEIKATEVKPFDPKTVQDEF